MPDTDALGFSDRRGAFVGQNGFVGARLGNHALLKIATVCAQICPCFQLFGRNRRSYGARFTLAAQYQNKLSAMKSRLTLIAALLVTIGGCTKGRYVDPDAPRIVQAAQRGQLQKVKDILERDGSALNHVDSKGNTAATWAVLNDHHEIAIYLIESGYPINPQHKDDFPLIMACLSRFTEGSRDMLRYLLANGADPNVVYEPEGWVPLNMAANNGSEEYVRILARYGARLDSKDRFGQTPLEAAKKQVAKFRDPNFDYPHGELSDPKVREDFIEREERMVKLLTELEAGSASASLPPQ